MKNSLSFDILHIQKVFTSLIAGRAKRKFRKLGENCNLSALLNFASLNVILPKIRVKSCYLIPMSDSFLLGENTYGKGSVQSIIPLKNDGAIRLTISKYYLPSGKSISEIGVTPDIKVVESSDDFKLNSDTDNQLDFALKLLNG